MKHFDGKNLITEETINTIVKQNNGKFLLTVYDYGWPVFSCEYDTMRGAKAAANIQDKKQIEKELQLNRKTDTEKAIEKAAERIAFIIHSTKDNKEYNAHNLAIDSLNIAKDIVLNEIDNVQFIPGEPNSKTGIKSIDLLPSVTCHARCRETCGKIEKGRKFNKGRCYAFKLMYRNPVTCARYAINTALLMYKPEVFYAGIKNLIKTQRFIRCFVAGDANIPGFFDNLCKILTENPHCMVQGFSKCYEIVNAYIDENGKLPDNLKQLLSGWEDMKPINPHNLPISDVYENELPNGWLSCGGNCLNCACVGLGCWKASAGDVVGLKKH